VLLAYPDNPAGGVFLKTLTARGISISGIVAEKKRIAHNWSRLKTKIYKDGFRETGRRLFQVALLKTAGHTLERSARKMGIPFFRVEQFNSRACAGLLDTLNPDLLVIASAPILKESVFSKCRIGCLNVHPGWLPRFRGYGANANAVLQGELPGVTVHFIDSGIDTGKIVVRERLPLEKRDTVAKINDRAVRRGAMLLSDAILRIQRNALVMPDIREKSGLLYPHMPYRQARSVNRLLKKTPFPGGPNE
jgi:methionyl-tRNA formyltransferase